MLNMYQHKVTTIVQSVSDCGELQSRWDVYCAYIKDFEVDPGELIPIVQEALETALKQDS